MRGCVVAAVKGTWLLAGALVGWLHHTRSIVSAKPAPTPDLNQHRAAWPETCGCLDTMWGLR
jgi:hypothetical protein